MDTINHSVRELSGAEVPVATICPETGEAELECSCASCEAHGLTGGVVAGLIDAGISPSAFAAEWPTCVLCESRLAVSSLPVFEGSPPDVCQLCAALRGFAVRGGVGMAR